MKKRQVMALILAVALAVPSVSLGSNMAVGVPASVEAAAGDDAGAGLVQASASVDLSNVRGDVITAAEAVPEKVTTTKIQEALDAEFGPVIIDDGDVAEDIITEGNGITLVNPKQALKAGENKLKVKCELPSDYANVGNGWEDYDETTKQWSAVFDVTFEVTKGIHYGNTPIVWPELAKEKTYVPGKEAHELWAEDVQKAENNLSDIGTFSVIDEDTAGSAGAKTLKVAFNLKPGYAFFAKGASGDVLGIPDGAKRCVKTYSVTIAKKVINKDDITWPEPKVDKDKVSYKGTIKDDGTGTVGAISVDTPDDSLVEFDLASKTDNTYSAITSETFDKVGVTSYYISAKVNSSHADNYTLGDDAISGFYYSNEKSVEVSKVKPTVKVSGEYTVGGKKTAIADASSGVILGTASTDRSLTAGLDVNNAVTSLDTTAYDPTYQWYKNGEPVEGATAEKLSLAADVNAAGTYYCKVNAPFAGDATKTDMDKLETGTFESEQIVVAVSDLAGVTTTTGEAEKTGGVYGEQNLSYKYTIAGLTAENEVELIVKDANGKDITAQVDKLITLSRAANNPDFTVTVDKNVGVGTYKFGFKVTEGKNNTSILMAPEKLTSDGTKNYTCAITPKEVTVVSSQIEATKAQEYGASIDELKFQYKPDTAGGNGLRDQAIADKITITLDDSMKTTNSSKGYLAYNANASVTVKVALKDEYKDNYTFTINGGAASNLAKTATATVKMTQKKVDLSVEAVKPVVKGDALPTSNLKVVGNDKFIEKDEVEVDVDSYTLYDKTLKEITNGIKSLPAGDYTIKPKFVYKVAGSVGAPPAGYDVTVVNSDLPIYSSVHTVGFVTYGDTNLPNKEVGHGDVLAKPADPTRAGYKFAGWYTDKDFKNAYDFSKAVEGDFNLYAKWEKVSGTNGGQNSADAVKAGTTTKTSAGTFAVINASTRTVAYKAASKSAKKVTVPSSVTIKGVSYKVTKIDNNAFKNCKKLTKVSIPSTVTEIGTAAFKGCKKLTSVTIPKNVNKIGKEAFSGCSKLKKVTIKSTKIKSVGKNAFKGIAKKSAIKTPKSKKAAYKKILKKSGYKKTVK